MVAVTSAENAARRRLYDTGASDGEIARQRGVTRGGVLRWRQRLGLARNREPVTITPDGHAYRLSLHQSGMDDRQIAAAIGIRRNHVLDWRKRHGLSANNNSANLTIEQNAARMLLYQLRWSDVRIAREQHVHSTVIGRWRAIRKLAPNGHLKRRGTVADVMARVRLAVGRGLPPDIAEDAVADLCLSVLDGTICLDEIERQARRYGNRVLEKYASRYGPKSLDEERGDDDGFRMIDMIRDDRSSSWLEEMGATVW